MGEVVELLNPTTTELVVLALNIGSEGSPPDFMQLLRFIVQIQYWRCQHRSHRCDRSGVSS